MSVRIIHRYPVSSVFATIVALVSISYSSGFFAPFYLDDFSSIAENRAILQADWPLVWAQYASRIVGYASFAINVSLLDSSPESLRIINIFIHTLVALTIFIVSRSILTTTHEPTEQKSLIIIAALSAVFFAIHPLNTAAVTYIVQRLASLAALFYLFALYSYIQSRITNKVYWWALCSLSIICALLTKQNTVTIFLTIYLAELVLIRRVSTRTVIIHIFIALVLAATFLTSIYFFDIGWSTFDRLSRETLLISRTEYFYAQLAVIGHYIMTFFYPNNLILDYGQPLTYWENKHNVLWGIFHVAVIMFALFNVKKRPVVSFWILFYYIALSVESTIIPIKDLIFEHRSYLPNVALSFLSIYSAFSIYKKLNLKWKMPGFSVVLIALICALMARTYARNADWTDPHAFFESEIKMNNNFWRSRNELASMYINDGELEKAMSLLNIEELNPGSHPSLLINALNISVQQKNIALSGQLIEIFGATLIESHFRYKSRFYSLAGQHYMHANNMPKAIEHLNIGLTLRPNAIEVMANLGIAYALVGNFDEAERLLVNAISLRPDSDKLKNNLNVLDTLRERQLN